MGYALLGASGESALNAATDYWPITGRFSPSNTEGFAKEWKTPVAGTIDKQYVYFSNLGTARKMRSRKDTGGGFAYGNLNPTITDSTANTYSDLSGIDILAANDFYAFEGARTGSNPIVYWQTLRFLPNSGQVQPYMNQGGVFSSLGTNVFVGISGITNVSATEANVETEVRVAGTRANVHLSISLNTMSGGNARLVITGRKNGVDTGSFTITAAQGTGYFTDGGAIFDSVVSGDKLALKVLLDCSSGQVNINGIVQHITAASGSASDVFVGGSYARSFSTTVHYTPAVGSIFNLIATTETERKSVIPFNCILSNFRFKPEANTTATQGTTITLRKNGVDTNIVLTIPTGSTTLVEDTTHTLALQAGDTLSVSIVSVAGGSGILTSNYFAYTLASSFYLPSNLAGRLQQLGGFVG